MKRKIFFILTIVVSIQVYSQTPNEINIDIQKVSKLTVKIFQEHGIYGLIGASKKCYSEISQHNLYCVYLDVSARRMEHLSISAFWDNNKINIPPEPYFSDKEFGSRIAPIFKSHNFTMDQANIYLQYAIPLINDKLDDTLEQLITH